ncbi:protein FAR1-RELATED SEQUENCE 7-like [Rhododendron vialii]|uniref:protein FAR1-RELATED SEQUENCE 7-like n=1 Tax=Rhododendron vialii TaxID=182163 RepID=UPI00265DF976|nr:protein FAR1-RELATED SEQUENCE 7-like [Rhododendron vialii]
MTSSQRAEISHSFFKKCVSLNNSLYDFVTQFARGLAHIRHNELDLDHKDLNKKPQLITSFPIESTMSELYTLAIFHKFQDELFQSGAYMVKMTHEDEHYRFYTVERAKVSGSRVRNLLVNKSSEHVSYSCKMFEFDGIPCRHLLAYFHRMQILDLPDELILVRWTKSAKIKTVVNDLGGSVQEICGISVLERLNKLFKLAYSVIDDAVLTEYGSELLEEALCSVQNKVRAMSLGSEGGKLGASVSQVSIPREHIFKEPLQVRAKGCGK